MGVIRRESAGSAPRALRHRDVEQRLLDARGRLTDRDRAICRLLCEHRVLTTSQVADIGFTGHRRDGMRLGELYAWRWSTPSDPGPKRHRLRITGCWDRWAPRWCSRTRRRHRGARLAQRTARRCCRQPAPGAPRGHQRLFHRAHPLRPPSGTSSPQLLGTESDSSLGVARLTDREVTSVIGGHSRSPFRLTRERYRSICRAAKLAGGRLRRRQCHPVRDSEPTPGIG
jgi:hypothetical protein